MSRRAWKPGDRLSIQIGEHIYETPPIPERKDILFHDLPREEQFWRRQKDFPKIFFDWHDEATGSGPGVELDAKKTEYSDVGQLLSLSIEDTGILFDRKADNGKEGLQEREYRRRKEGVWFFNDGEPTYLTGNHYAILQWLPMLGCSNSIEPGSSYGQYYQFQRDAAYYFEYCKTVPFARGGLYIKPKKTGMTQFFSLICTNEAMTTREKTIRMMSITETLCKESNFGFVKFALQKVPNILMPSRSKQNEHDVIFGPPNSSKNQLKKKRNIDIEYLNTWLCTVPTARTSFDTFTNYIALIDEFPKIKETYPAELFLATVPTVMEGFRRKGTIFGLSYVPESSDRSFYEARQLYKDSKLKTRKLNEDGEPYGETKSKLICHTLTVQEGMFNCCDKYGKPIERLIWEAIKQEIEDVKHDPIKLQATKRQYPTSEADPWQEGSREDTLFDNFRLSKKLQDLEEAHSVNNFPYEDFNFVFEKLPIKDPKTELLKFEGKIGLRFITDEQKFRGEEHGRFKWYRRSWMPDWFLDKYTNKVFTDQNTKLRRPNPDSPFLISIDPTKWRLSKYTGKASLNAIQVFVLPNAELNGAIGKNVTNRRVFITYLYRHQRPMDTLMDIIATILYFGCMVHIESNVDTWTTKLIDMGLGHFLLMANDEGGMEPWVPYNDKLKYFTATKAQIDQYVDSAQEFLGEPLMEGDIDNIDYLDDMDIIQQLLPFRKDNTTEYDAGVAYMQGLMAIDYYLGWKRANTQSNFADETYRRFVIGAIS